MITAMAKDFFEKGGILFLQQLISADPGDHKGPGHKSSQNRVRELQQQLAVRNQC